jgi:hypothetical protein
MKRLQLAIVLVASPLLVGAEGCVPEGNGGDARRSKLEKVTVAKAVVKNGFFDTSIEYGDDGVGWLAYSRVEVPKFVETNLAKTTDEGRSWTHVATVNESTEGSLEDGGKTIKGVWRSETPSLLFDRRDSPERRWKLFSQRYLTVRPYKEKNRLFDKGWIEYRTAENPGGPWSEPIRLFGKKESGSLVDPTTLDDDVARMSHFNEIGSIEVDGTIYLSMDASSTPSGFGNWEERRVVLFSSQDHGKTWIYNGTLTDYDDAERFGYLVFTGSSLVREGRKLYLLITPSGGKKKNRGHDGTYAVEFDDLSKAKLKRDRDGQLVVTSKFDIDLFSGGLSDYDEKNTYGGLLMAQIDLKARPDVFQTYSTRRRIEQK